MPCIPHLPQSHIHHKAALHLLHLSLRAAPICTLRNRSASLPARGFVCMSACLKIPNRARDARMQGRGDVQLTPWHFHPPLLPPSSNRPKVQITTFSTPPQPPSHHREKSERKKWERDGLPCPNRSLFPTLVQKVSKKENTTKIFLKLSFFGNISVCVVAVKAVYWGTGPVSGVSCCGDSLESTSSSRRRQLPPPISCRTH